MAKNLAGHCPAEYETPDMYRICDLPRGHAGLHWDRVDDEHWAMTGTLSAGQEPEPGGATSAWEHHRD